MVRVELGLHVVTMAGNRRMDSDPRTRHRRPCLERRGLNFLFGLNAAAPTGLDLNRKRQSPRHRHRTEHLHHAAIKVVNRHRTCVAVRSRIPDLKRKSVRGHRPGFSVRIGYNRRHAMSFTTRPRSAGRRRHEPPRTLRLSAIQSVAVALPKKRAAKELTAIRPDRLAVRSLGAA